MPRSDIEVVLGSHNYTLEETDLRIRVKYAIIHPYYHNLVYLDNDIALLRLEEPVDLYIYTPVCLPYFGQDFTGQAAWIAGQFSLS